jgi:hypothetical protein
MSRIDSQVLSDEVKRFAAELHRLAYEIVHVVLRQELDAKLAQRKPAPAAVGRSRNGRSATKSKERAARPAKAKAEQRRAKQQAAQQLELTLQDAAVQQQEAERAEAANAEQAPPPSAIETGKRRRWTRESIIEELARWMVTGTVIDARFATRHGPPGLVAAARRIFGRFDAALNVASLHVTKLYPDGPPPQRPIPKRPPPPAAPVTTEAQEAAPPPPGNGG